MANYDYYPGIVHGKAKYSDYLTYKTRLLTFEDENDFYKALAKAGFYFKGKYLIKLLHFKNL